jgi:hypothetical protein
MMVRKAEEWSSYSVPYWGESGQQALEAPTNTMLPSFCLVNDPSGQADETECSWGAYTLGSKDVEHDDNWFPSFSWGRGVASHGYLMRRIKIETLSQYLQPGAAHWLGSTRALYPTKQVWQTIHPMWYFDGSLGAYWNRRRLKKTKRVMGAWEYSIDWNK